MFSHNDPADFKKNRPPISLDALLVGTACIGLVLMFAYRMGPAVVDLDLWHQMALIRDAVELGYLPYEDHFAYTETLYPCVQHEWGAGAIALLLANGPGAIGVVILRLLVAAVLCSLVVKGARMHGARTAVLLFLLPLPILLIDQGFSAIRAQMYSFLCVAVLLVFLQCDRREQRWWIPVWLVVFVFWVNVHAGFLVGVGLMGMWWLEQVFRRRRHKHLAFLGLAMGVLISATPYGLHYFSYLWRAVTMNRPHVSEWFPLYQAESWSHLVLFAVSLILAGYGIAARRLSNAEGVLLVAVTAIAALKSSRLVFFYAIVWASFVPGWLQHTGLGIRIENLHMKFRRFLIGFWMVVAVILLVRLVAFQPWRLHVPGGPQPSWGKHATYPVGPVDYLATKCFEGNVMVPFDWGAYVIWKLHPKVKVSLDSRYEVAYPDHVAAEQYSLYMGSDDWHQLFSKYASDVILVHVNLPLADRLPDVHGWKMVYKDKLWALYARDGIDLPMEQHPERVFSGQFP